MADRILLILSVIFVLDFAITCKATTYNVGDTSGWDISTDLDTWAADKKFKVGDVLTFLYSSSDNVCEVKRESFDKCNTTNVIKTYTNGNTSVTLTRPGAWYFISGNRLYCLGGMKLQASVEGDEASSPAYAPQSQQDPLPRPSTKSNTPTTIIPTSNGFLVRGMNFVMFSFVGFAVTILGFV